MQMKFTQIVIDSEVDSDGYAMNTTIMAVGEDGRVYTYVDGLDPVTHQRTSTAYWQQMSNEIEPWT